MSEIAELRGELKGKAAALPYQRMLRNRFLLGLGLLTIVGVAGWFLKPATQAQVWANSQSRIYHCGSSPASAAGRVMSEKQATREGYRPAGGKVCR